MKSIFIGTASTAAMTLLSWSTILTNPAAAGEPSNNLLRNSSLEGTETPFTDTSWNSGPESEGVEYVWEVGPDGKNSYLKITKEESNHSSIASWEQTFAYNTTAPALTVTAKVKTVKVTKAVIDAVFLDVHGSVVRHKQIAYIGPKKKGGAPVDHDWKEYSGTIAIPPACRKIIIALQDYGSGTVMFDDITAVYENDSSKVKNALNADATEFNHSRSDADQSFNQIATKEAPTSAQPYPPYAAANQLPPVLGTTSFTPLPIIQGNMDVGGVEVFYNPLMHSTPVNGGSIVDVNENAVYRTSDRKQFKNEDAAKAHASTLKLTKQYHHEADPAAKVQLREDLVAAVTTDYDHMRAERINEIEELTKKLEELKAKLDKRDAVKDKIIEKRVEQLLGVDELYQWDTDSQEPFVTLGPQPGSFMRAPAGYQPFGPGLTPGPVTTPSSQPPL